MIRARWLVALGAAAYLLSLVLLIPASLVHQRAGLGEGPVGVHAVEGTVWSGRGMLVIRGHALGPVSWDARPMRLAFGRAEWGLTLGDGPEPLRAAAGYGLTAGPYVGELQGRFPAERLAPLLPLSGVSLAGTFTVDVGRIRLDQGMPADADGNAAWDGAAAGLGRPVPLGGLQAELAPAEPGVRADLSDDGGPLALDGQASLRPDGRYDVRLSVGARSDAGDDLRALLEMMGPPGPDGKRRISLSGVL